jgi:hypothetical protein
MKMLSSLDLPICLKTPLLASVCFITNLPMLDLATSFPSLYFLLLIPIHVSAVVIEFEGKIITVDKPRTDHDSSGRATVICPDYCLWIVRYRQRDPVRH